RSVPGMNLERPGRRKNLDLTLRINVPAALPRALRSRRPLPARLEPLPRTGRSDGPVIVQGLRIKTDAAEGFVSASWIYASLQSGLRESPASPWGVGI